MSIGWAVRSALEWLVELIEGGDGTRAIVLGWKRAALRRLGPSVSAAGKNVLHVVRIFLPSAGIGKMDEINQKLQHRYNGHTASVARKKW